MGPLQKECWSRDLASLWIPPGQGGTSKTVWFQCLALKDQAEFVKRSLNHGDAVYVEGSLEPYEYSPQGSKQRLQAFRILVDRIRPLGRNPAPAFDFATVQ